MLTTLEKMLDLTAGNYLEPGDLDTLNACSQSFKPRILLYTALQQQEAWIVAKVLLREKQPAHPHAQSLTLVVRYCAMAMLLNDPAFLQERLLEWLPTATQATGRQQTLYSLCMMLNVVLSEQLPRHQSQLLNQFVAQVCEALHPGKN